MFDLDKEAKGEVIDELLSMLGKRSKDKLVKVFGLPEDMKGKVSVSEKSYVIPFGKKKEDKEDYEDKEDNKENLSDDIHHFEDIYKDNFDDVDNDHPYDEKFQDHKEAYEDMEESEDDDDLSRKEKKLLSLLKKGF